MEVDVKQLVEILDDQVVHMDEELAFKLASHCRKNNIKVEIGKYNFDTWYVRKPGA